MSDNPVEDALIRCENALEEVRGWEEIYKPGEAMDDEYFAGCRRLDEEAIATLRVALGD